MTTRPGPNTASACGQTLRPGCGGPAPGGRRPHRASRSCGVGHLVAHVVRPDARADARARAGAARWSQGAWFRVAAGSGPCQSRDCVDLPPRLAEKAHLTAPNGTHDHARALPAQQPDPPEGAVRAARSAARPDVRVRPDGLRPGAYRQRAAGGGVRRAGAAAAAAVSARDLCAQHHRRRRQDQRARGRAGRPDRGADRAHDGGFPRRHGGAGRAAAGCGAARDRAYPRDDRDHRAADRRRATPMRPRATCCSRWRAIRPTASCPAAARTSCWPARGSTWRRTSATPAISCCGSRPRPSPGRARPAGLGQPVGPRPAGLAYRVQRDVVELSGREVRHPWRRHRPDLSAPRERDGAELLRVPRQPVSPATGCTTACCW